MYFKKLNKFSCLLVLQLMFFTSFAYSNNIKNYGCNGEVFLNSYFLIGVNEIGAVSVFFQKMFDDYSSGMPPFQSVVGSRKRVETYFDFEDHRLLNNSRELVLVLAENLPDYRAGREKVFYRDFGAGSKKLIEFTVKRYNKKITRLDKHVLFGRVKRKDREMLLNELELIDQPSYGMVTKKLQVSHEELVFLITRYGEPVAEISLDEFHISNFGLRNTSLIMKFESLFTDNIIINNLEKKVVNKILCDIEMDFRKKFPGIKSTGWFGYADYQRIASDMLPSRDFFQKYPLLYMMGQVIVLIFIGFLIIYLVLSRYSSSGNYKDRGCKKVVKSHEIKSSRFKSDDK